MPPTDTANPFAPKDPRTHRQSNSPLLYLTASYRHRARHLHQQGVVIDNIPQRQHTCPKNFPTPFAPKDIRTAHRQSNSPLLYLSASYRPTSSGKER